MHKIRNLACRIWDFDIAKKLCISAWILAHVPVIENKESYKQYNVQKSGSLILNCSGIFEKDLANQI